MSVITLKNTEELSPQQPQQQPQVLRLKLSKQVPTSAEYADMCTLIRRGQIVEFVKKYWNYVVSDSQLSGAIIARMDMIVHHAIKTGTVATYKHLKDAATTGQFHLFDILIEGGADIHHNDDELLFYITSHYVKPFYEKTHAELPLLIEKYRMTKTVKNYGFDSDTAESNGEC